MAHFSPLPKANGFILQPGRPALRVSLEAQWYVSLDRAADGSFAVLDAATAPPQVLALLRPQRWALWAEVAERPKIKRLGAQEGPPRWPADVVITQAGRMAGLAALEGMAIEDETQLVGELRRRCLELSSCNNRGEG